MLSRVLEPGDLALVNIDDAQMTCRSRVIVATREPSKHQGRGVTHMLTPTRVHSEADGIIAFTAFKR